MYIYLSLWLCTHAGITYNDVLMYVQIQPYVCMCHYIHVYLHTHTYIWSRAPRPPHPHPKWSGKAPSFCGVGCGGIDWESPSLLLCLWCGVWWVGVPLPSSAVVWGLVGGIPSPSFSPCGVGPCGWESPSLFPPLRCGATIKSRSSLTAIYDENFSPTPVQSHPCGLNKRPGLNMLVHP